MPIASTKQKQQTRNTNTTSQKIPGWQKNLLIIGAGIAVIGVAAFFMFGGSMIDKKIIMAEYLQEKYGKEFLVENYRVEGSGIGTKGTPVADAQPLDDPSLKFKVSERGKGKKVFADTYAQLYWSKQGQEVLDREVRSLMPDVRLVNFSVTGDLYQNFHTMENYPFKGTIPDVRTVFKDYPDKLKASFAVHSSMLSAGQEPTSAQLSRAYDVIVIAKKLGIVNGTVGYTYNPTDNDKIDDHDGGVPRYNIIVEAEQLENIQRPEQLEQYFIDRESGEK